MQLKRYRDLLINMDFKAYQNSPVTQKAVERDFEIIGEALNRIKKIDVEFIERISEHYRIIGFRNILIHGYDIVDKMIVWKAVKNHLPSLIKEVMESELKTKVDGFAKTVS